MIYMNKLERFGTKFLEDDVIEIITKERPFIIKIQNNEIIKTESIIIASGAKSLWLNAKGEEKLKGNGGKYMCYMRWSIF